MKTSTFKHAMVAGAVALALGSAGLSFADDSTNSKTTPNTAMSNTTSTTAPMTGKQKATAIGAGSGAAVGAVVGGPVGAVVGAGVGAVVGHQGTDANGHVSDGDKHWSKGDAQVRKAQAALNEQGYSLTVDGRMGPNTQDAVRSYQEKNGLATSGTLDGDTLNKLGVKS